MKLTLATSDQCGPCHMLKNKLEAKNLKVEIKSFNDPENIEFFRKHEIKSVPRLVVEGGDKVEIIQGMDDIIFKISQHQ
jgi:glutaredoxin